MQTVLSPRQRHFSSMILRKKAPTIIYFKRWAMRVAMIRRKPEPKADDYDQVFISYRLARARLFLLSPRAIWVDSNEEARRCPCRRE